MSPEVATSELAKLSRVTRLMRDTGNIKRPDGKWVDLMSPQAFHIILEVAQNPGLTAKQLMAASGLTLSSISRNLMALGEWHRSDMPGLGLIETVADPREYRRNVVFLTIKGRSFMSEIVSIQINERVRVEFPTAYEFMNCWPARSDEPH